MHRTLSTHAASAGGTHSQSCGSQCPPLMQNTLPTPAQPASPPIGATTIELLLDSAGSVGEVLTAQPTTPMTETIPATTYVMSFIVPLLCSDGEMTCNQCSGA